MPITTTYRSLENSLQALNVLLEKRLPGLTSLHLAKIAQLIEAAKKGLNKTRDALAAQYAKKDAEGKMVPADTVGAVLLEDPDTYWAEMNSVLDAPIEFDIEKLDKSVLASIEIEPVHLLQLLWMID
jgi:hypothetical protein